MPTISLVVDARQAKSGSDIATDSLNKVKVAANDAQRSLESTSKSFSTFSLNASRSQKDLLSDGKRIFDETRTSQEKYAASLSNLSELFKAGAIDQDTYNRALNDLDSKYLNIASVATKVAGAITLIAGASIAAGRSALNNADDLNALSQAAGVSAERLQVLRFAFQAQNIAATQTDRALSTFNRNIGLATEGAGPAADVFESLGISIKDAGGEIKSTEQLFYESSTAIGQLSSQQEQAAAAGRLFGREVGTKLAPLIAQGTGEIDKMEQRLRSIGGVMSNDIVEAGDRVNSSMEQLTTVFKSAFNGAIVKSFTDEFKDFDGQLDNTTRAARTLGSVFGFVFTGIVSGAAGATNAVSDIFNNASAAYDDLQNKLKRGPADSKNLQTGTLLTNITNLKDRAGELNNRETAEFPNTPLSLIIGKSDRIIAKENEYFERNKKQAQELLKQADQLQKIIDERVKKDSPTPTVQKQSFGPGADKFFEEQEKRQKELQKEGQGVFSATRNPQEKYTEGIEKLSKLLKNGAIDQDTYNRAVRELKSDLFPVEKAVRTITPAQKEYNETQQRGAEITAEVATEQEKYSKSLTELDTLLKRNVISQETYSRATKELTDNLSENVKSREALKKQQEDQERLEKANSDALQTRASKVTEETRTDDEKYRLEKQNIDELLQAKLISEDIYNRKLRDIGEQFGKNSGLAKAFTDTLEESFDSLIAQSTSFEDGLKKIGLQLAANIAKQVVTPYINKSVGSFFESVLGSAATAAAGSLGSNIGTSGNYQIGGGGLNTQPSTGYQVGGGVPNLKIPSSPAVASSGNYSFGGARAEGGPVSFGKAYLVGENGPEMFYPERNGAISPNKGRQNIVININAKDAQSVINSRAQISSQLVYAIRQGDKNQ